MRIAIYKIDYNSAKYLIKDEDAKYLVIDLDETKRLTATKNYNKALEIQNDWEKLIKEKEKENENN